MLGEITCTSTYFISTGLLPENADESLSTPADTTDKDYQINIFERFDVNCN